MSVMIPLQKTACLAGSYDVVVCGGGVAGFQTPFRGIETAARGAEMGLFLLQRHIQQCQKGHIVTEGEAGQQAVSLAHLLAQGAVDALVLLIFSHGDGGLKQPHVSEHPPSPPRWLSYRIFAATV